MLSMDELRQIAAESHLDELDGPRGGETGPQTTRRAGAGDEAYAREQAPPGVFRPHPQAPQPAPGSGRETFPSPPAVAPAHSPQHPGQAQHGSQVPYAGAVPAGGAQSAGGALFAGGAAGAGAGQAGAGKAEAAPRRRGMPALAVIAIVVAALVVCGVGGWIVYDVVTGGDRQAESVPAPPVPAETEDGGGDELVTGETEAPADGAAEAFVTPSGNIGCTIDEERARCIIRSGDFEPPQAPDSCEMEEWGSIIVANREGAGFSCTEASFPVGGDTLEYGESVSAHGMRCESTERGVRCESEETGAGFLLARAGATFDQP